MFYVVGLIYEDNIGQYVAIILLVNIFFWFVLVYNYEKSNKDKRSSMFYISS